MTPHLPFICLVLLFFFPGLCDPPHDHPPLSFTFFQGSLVFYQRSTSSLFSCQAYRLSLRRFFPEALTTFHGVLPLFLVFTGASLCPSWFRFLDRPSSRKSLPPPDWLYCPFLWPSSLFLGVVFLSLANPAFGLKRAFFKALPLFFSVRGLPVVPFFSETSDPTRFLLSYGPPRISSKTKLSLFTFCS